MSDLTIRQLLEAGVHFGHRTRFWNPKMAPYIFGARHGVHIINLEETLALFKDAVNFISRTAANRGKVLFVGTKYAAQNIIREQAERCQMPYVNYRWLGGMLTNYKTIRQSIKRLKEYEQMRDTNGFQGLTKKEKLNIIRELSKLELNLGGIKDMGGLPDALLVIDTGHEHIAIKEANRLGIPVIGIVDTNNDPDGINYLVPGNDDSLRSIRLYAQTVADAILAARAHIVEQEVLDEEAGDKRGKDQPQRKKVVKRKPAKVTKADAEPEVAAKEAKGDAKAEIKPAKKKTAKTAEDKTGEAKKAKVAVKASAKPKAAAKKADEQAVDAQPESDAS